VRDRMLFAGLTFLLFSPALARIAFKMHDASFEYRAYLSGAGFALVAAWALSRLPRWTVPVFAPALALTFAVYTSERNKVWNNGEAFWADVVKDNPSPRALTNLAVNYQRHQNLPAAID